jgi:hypothetical protein
MQNVGPIYKTKNVYSLMFMQVIIHRAYVLKLFLGILHLDRNHGCLQDYMKNIVISSRIMLLIYEGIL